MRDSSPSAHPAELVQEKRAERACPSACPLRGLVNAQHLQGLPQGPSYRHHTGGTAIQAGSESQSPASETLGEDACMGVTPEPQFPCLVMGLITLLTSWGQLQEVISTEPGIR